MKQLKVYHWKGFRGREQTSEFVAAESKAEVVRLAAATGQHPLRIREIAIISGARYLAIARNWPKQIFRCRARDEHSTMALYFREGDPEAKPIRAWLASFEKSYAAARNDDEVTRLRKLVSQGLAVVEDFASNIQHVSLQNYARYNDFCIEARKIKEQST